MAISGLFQIRGGSSRWKTMSPDEEHRTTFLVSGESDLAAGRESLMILVSSSCESRSFTRERLEVFLEEPIGDRACGEVKGPFRRVDPGSRQALPQVVRAQWASERDASQSLLRKAQRASTPRRTQTAPQGSPVRPRLIRLVRSARDVKPGFTRAFLLGSFKRGRRAAGPIARDSAGEAGLPRPAQMCRPARGSGQ